jgi:hypothetical protein
MGCNQTEQFDVKIFNEELILDLIKNNLGFILLGSHVGGFDVLQYLTPRYGHQAKIMMDVSHFLRQGGLEMRLKKIQGNWIQPKPCKITRNIESKPGAV